MSTSVKGASAAAPAWLHLHRASDAVSMATAELPRMQLSPQARQEFVLEVAALIGKVELLLSMLWRQDSQGSYRRRTRSA